MIRFIGDVHGKYQRYKRLIEEGNPPSIQVGDMGVGFRRYPHGNCQTNPPFDKMVAGNHRFIRGNHDNPGVCKNHRQCIADGTVENGMMFIGGADSIDKVMRIEGYSWWPDEQLGHAELEQLVGVYIQAKPRIMVTHDCPQPIAEKIARLAALDKTRTRNAFRIMLEHHHPRLWIFGHWHITFDEVIEGTRFICLPELDYIDFTI